MKSIQKELGEDGGGNAAEIAELRTLIEQAGMPEEVHKQAEKELGRKFDVRAFHDQVLGSGALPMAVLEAKIERWIAATKQR